MAPTIENICTRLETSVTAGYDLSNKLYRILQVLPSAVFEYGCFASQIMYLAANFEQINNVLPTLKLQAENGRLLEDLDKIISCAGEAYSEVGDALPQRPFDGAEVDLMLPFDAPALGDQIEALQVGSTLIMAVLQLAGTRPAAESTAPTSIRFAEAVVNQLKKAIRDLKCSQPKEGKRRGSALKRAKTHTVIAEYLDGLLVTVSELQKVSNGEDKTEGSKTSDATPEDGDDVKLEHYGAHPKDDGMPEYVRHRPDNVYAKVHVKDVDTRSLVYYNLPYSKAKENPNYYIIWKSMEPWECENLFQHTKKLHINEQHALVDNRAVVKQLLLKWLSIEIDGPSQESNTDLEELEKNLEELRAQDEKRKSFDRPIIRRERSWSPSPTPRNRVPLQRRMHYGPNPFGHTSRSEYWRSWEGQAATLNSALMAAGWKPVFMRGTTLGQTWYYGQDVVHVRRFTDDYTPQDGAIEDGKRDADVKEYLIIGSEWIEEEALNRHGFSFELLPSGYYSLDSRLTWGDLEAVVYISSTIREERLYRKYRATGKGDLSSTARIGIPESDYINGPIAFERLPNTGTAAVINVSATGDSEMPGKRVSDRKPIAARRRMESYDSYVEVNE